MRVGGQAGRRASARPRGRVVVALVALLLVVVTLRARSDAGPVAQPSAGHTGHDAMQMVAASAASYAASAPDLPRRGWTARADTATRGHRPAAAVDGRRGTSWLTRPGARAPHVLTLDTRRLQPMSGLRYTPETRRADRRIGRYTVQLSRDGRRFTTVTRGLWADTGDARTASFAVTEARFVRLSVTNVDSPRRPVAVPDLVVLGARLGPPLTRTGWSATADSQAGDRAPALVVDGDPDTYWSSTTDAGHAGHPLALPHVLTLDTGAPRLVGALSYTPRQDGRAPGRIGAYAVETSLDGSAWRRAATGTWADDATTKTVTLGAPSSPGPVLARYVRVLARTEAGSRGPWSTAAEVNLYGPPTGPSLDPAGWGVTADAAASGHDAALALDGDPRTTWQTPAGGQRLPHTLTIDTRARHRISGLTYLPRQDVSPDGTMGRYRVQVSDDGRSWSPPVASGTWADDRLVKTVRFAPVAARYVRLVALSEAGGRGSWSSAAEVGLVGTVVDPGTQGVWSPTIGLPIVPTSATLLRHDKVLTFSAAFDDDYDIDTTHLTQVSIVDLAQADGGRPARRTVSDTGHQMFCTGLSVLADGRVLITGGSSPSNATIYDPATDEFTVAPQMEVPRGYQSSVTLSDGGVFTIGGSWSGPVEGVDGAVKNGEVLRAGADEWRSLPGTSNQALLTDDGEAYRRDNHTWLFATTGGRVFQAGPSRAMNWFTTTGAGTTTSAGQRADAPDQMNGNAVMYDAGKVLTLGGSPAYGYSEATARAYTIDLTAGFPAAPVVTRQPDLAQRRAFANSVVLPDGSVLVTGGQSYAVPFTDTTAQLSAELWSPRTGRFETLAPEAVPRTYHSFSLLLADGRVLSGGGGLEPNATINHPDVQVFTPPYLLEPDGSPRERPAITSAVPGGEMAAGSTVRVTTDGPVASWAMVRTSAVTHSINTDQRRFTLPATPVAGQPDTYDLTVPADRGTSVPGTYLLFALDAAGTPSRGQWVAVPL
ncbi:discoidin domain-containing protein [Nocardioides rubriscoriae]|uniref:discoidin domain-containing protein n=1 Tax=Nocardioides rubriscoriae TaxID=642762 RepID=UPI001B873F8D|nr:discoidin domain-containing protein [Nocardioides rubriscoriae]